MNFSSTQNPLSLEMSSLWVCVANLQLLAHTHAVRVHTYFMHTHGNADTLSIQVVDSGCLTWLKNLNKMFSQPEKYNLPY